MANPNFYSTLEQKVANLWNTEHALAQEGSFYVATNPTPGTVIATTTSVVDAGNAGATSAQTRPVMMIGNNWVAGDPNAKTIYIQSMRMRIVQVPTSATQWNMAMWLDTLTNAYVSGGSTIVPVNVNWGTQSVSKAQIYFGAITANASTGQARLVNNTRISSTIPVTQDEWMIIFGSPNFPTNIGTDSTVQRRISLESAPIAISPGSVLKIGMWGTANAAAPSWEFELNYVER